MEITDGRYPITVVTGFLGSGKTTLLSNVLQHEQYKNTAVIINEYGQAGLDHRLIRRIEEKTRLLSGGCICCNMRDDLINEIKEILNETERGEIKMNRVVIETTGLADPAPILFSILMDPLLTNRFYVDATVCCLDAANGELHLENNPESVKQIAVADTIIITKTDIVEKETVAEMRRRLMQLNPAAIVLEAANGKIDANQVFANSQNQMSDKISKLASQKESFKQSDAMHNTSVRSMAIGFKKPLDWTAFGLWMSMLLFSHGEKMLRIKGMIDVGAQGPVVINGVQHIIHPPHHLDDWNGEEHDSQIVFIMKDLEPAQIMSSLMAFQSIIGSTPEIKEINLNPYAKN
ncbi:MAG: GTP-binding protein [Phascolarctobacterium sp.]|nr:GTP-binding protein [Phascolarctobacterium sp.]